MLSVLSPAMENPNVANSSCASSPSKAQLVLESFL